MNKISLIIIEDHTIFIEGLQSILQKINEVEVKDSFTNGESALEFMNHNPVDIALLDISLPGISGVEVCKAMKTRWPQTKVIALTNHTEKSIILEMLNAGADGYLLKNTTGDDLADAIQQALNGQFLMKSELQKLLFSGKDKKGEIPRLTKREQEILSMVGEGATTASIASQLFISTQTVETHRHNLMQKFKVNNSALLIKKAVEFGLLK